MVERMPRHTGQSPHSMNLAPATAEYHTAFGSEIREVPSRKDAYLLTSKRSHVDSNIASNDACSIIHRLVPARTMLDSLCD